MTTIGSRELMAEIIMRMDQAGLHHRALLIRTAAAGTICLIEPARDGVPSFKATDRAGRPALVVLGDDDYASTGPAGWAIFRRLSYWARGAIVHASGADVRSYQAVVDATVRCRRFVLIETDFAHARQWGEALLKAPRPILVSCLVPADAKHPVTPAVV
jgi:hypothetical protein